MEEKQFQRDFLFSLEQRGIFACKIPDAIRSPQSRFIPIKPFDMFILNGGVFYALELKYFKVQKLKTKYSSFPLSKIRDNQLRNLRSVANNGGRGFVPVCCDISATDLGDSFICFFIPISDIKDNKGVMEFEQLSRYKYIKLRENKNGTKMKHRWNVDNIFEIME